MDRSTDMKNILLCVAFALWAQQTTTYNTGAGHGTPMIPTAQSKLPNAFPPVSVTWTYDPQQEMLNLRLTNNSGKDITAYNVSITRRYSNRSTGNTHGSPTVSEMMEQTGFTHSRMFAAGTSRNQHNPEPKDITDVQAVVDMVIFADATGYVQNERAFKNIMAMRKGTLMAMQNVDETIKRVLADPLNEEPIAQVMTELISMAFAPQTKLVPLGGRPEDAEGNQQIELQSNLQNLRRMQQTQINERESLTNYAEELEKRIELMKPHCEIAVTK